MRFSLRNRASPSRSAVVSPVLPPVRSARACSTHSRNADGVRSSSRATAPTVLPSSSTNRTAWARNSSLNCRRTRRLPLLHPMRAIVSTFRKVSTETDQAHPDRAPSNDVDRACQRHDECYGRLGVSGFGGLGGGGGTDLACKLDQCDSNLCSETMEAVPRLKMGWDRLIGNSIVQIFCLRYRLPPTVVSPPRPPSWPCVATAKGRIFCYPPR